MEDRNPLLQPFTLGDVNAAHGPAERALAHGDWVGRFEIDRVLAESGVAIVYLVTDHSGQAQLVLKEYMPLRLARRDSGQVLACAPMHAAAFEQGLQAFVNEAQLLAQVNHPALARVIDLLRINATAYQVMPFYDGVPMRQARHALDVPPGAAALGAVVDGLLGALWALHQSGHLHGGIDPSKVLLLEHDSPLLLGPGSARAEVASERVESLMATVEASFAAPERLDPDPDLPPGPYSDLYELAGTIHFFLTAEPPALAVGLPVRVRSQPLAQTLERLFGADVAAQYDVALLDALDAALDPLPAARPQGVAEFRARASAKAAAVSVPAAPTASAEPAKGTRVEPGFDMMWSEPWPTNLQPESPRAERPLASAPQASGRRLLWWVGAVVLLLMGAAGGWWFSESVDPAPLDQRLTRGLGVPVPDAMPAPAAAAASVVAPPASASAAPVILEPPPVSAEAPTESVVAREPIPVTRKSADASAPAVHAAATSPRAICGARTQFALYNCMQTQCAQRGWASHPQCEHLRATDRVD